MAAGDVGNVAVVAKFKVEEVGRRLLGVGRRVVVGASGIFVEEISFIAAERTGVHAGYGNLTFEGILAIAAGVGIATDGKPVGCFIRWEIEVAFGIHFAGGRTVDEDAGLLGFLVIYGHDVV